MNVAVDKIKIVKKLKKILLGLGVSPNNFVKVDFRTKDQVFVTKGHSILC